MSKFSQEQHVSRGQTKTATLTLRVDPQIKSMLTAAAEADRRSLSNMLEVIVLEYCEQHGIASIKSLPRAKPPVAPRKKRVPA
ncbi:MAG TPA: hypothetical protein VMU57_00885 [Edaphobacter sp.]|uniref:hypothetical protein n=1 Tax=Edaphobacter sp. TaxID=1934404 RepID=UPI002D1C2D76|nr:hypothetical protein [Edaphobacter sp.]HUZ93446.1 hypothetical protein [Edaphobacter sp.]